MPVAVSSSLKKSPNSGFNKENVLNNSFATGHAPCRGALL